MTGEIIMSGFYVVASSSSPADRLHSVQSDRSGWGCVSHTAGYLKQDEEDEQFPILAKCISFNNLPALFCSSW